MSIENLGVKLRKLREEKELPLRKVAALIGIDVAILSKMERSQRKWTKEIITKLAKIYEYDLQKLLVLYLSDRVVNEIGTEELAINALKVAEKQIEYLSHSNTDYKTFIKSLKKFFANDGRVNKAWLFGSYSRDEYDYNSDLDILIQISNNSSFSLFDLADLQYQIEKFIPQKVDLVMYGSIKPALMQSIKPDLKILYARQ
ncbi:MAG: nucleotidyltransferase domain-containing protein [Ignavibacteria bacterium]